MNEPIGDAGVHVGVNGRARPWTPGRRRRTAGGLAVGIAILGVGGIGYYGLSARAARDQAPAVVRDVPYLDGPLIRFSQDFAARCGVAFAPCEMGQLAPSIGVTGTVVFDPDRVAAVGARIAGRVRALRKQPGDAVRAGEIVAELESAQLGEAQAALLAARAHAQIATANETRESQLAEAHVSSRREAEVAGAGAAAANAELFAAEQKIKAYGAASPGEVGVLTLASPIDGKIVDMHVSRGQSVEPSFTLFRVASLERVWIELAVFERDIGRVHLGDEVDLSPQTNASIVLHGRVAHVGDTIDLDTRSADVRVVVDNRDESLRPGQSVLARIHTSSAAAPVPLVPLDALTSIDGKPTVFVAHADVAHADTAVEPRSVLPGGRDGAHVEILAGLSEGERVVVRGVFPLKSEIFR